MWPFRRRSPYYIELKGVVTNLPRIRLSWKDAEGVLTSRTGSLARVYSFGDCTGAWLCHDRQGRLKEYTWEPMHLAPGDTVDLNHCLSAVIK